MKRFFIAACMFVNLSMLTACTTMNSSFDCPNKSGVSCKSLDQINGMVDSGQIRGRTQIAAEKNGNTISEVGRAEFQSFPAITAFAPGEPLRFGETVQRIWIAPYEDTEGNYHQDSLIYAIMKGGHWIGKPVKVVQSF